ncbi:MAG: hypothetical protein Q8P01_05045 [bacterium]|nr:hypothetical protein [bacterium]
MERNINVFFIGLFAFSLVALPGGILLAETSVAQSDAVQKATKEVKSSVGDLVTARDENVADDLALRIDAFKKVVDLSLSEAKDFKVKLLLAEKESKDIRFWRDSALDQLDRAIRYFEAQKEGGVSRFTSTEAIKELAGTFKDWRDVHYIPLTLSINDFLIVQKMEAITEVANGRSSKIAKDIVKLEKAGVAGASQLRVLLYKANVSIDASVEGGKNARALFLQTYVRPLLVTSTKDVSSSSLGIVASSSLTSLSPEESTSTPQTTLPVSDVQATSSAILPLQTSPNTVSSSSREAAPAANEGTSIKGLARDTFRNVKDAYQVFIEMSDFVRKLL